MNYFFASQNALHSYFQFDTLAASLSCHRKLLTGGLRLGTFYQKITDVPFFSKEITFVSLELIILIAQNSFIVIWISQFLTDQNSIETLKHHIFYVRPWSRAL